MDATERQSARLSAQTPPREPRRSRRDMSESAVKFYRDRLSSRLCARDNGVNSVMVPTVRRGKPMGGGTSAHRRCRSAQFERLFVGEEHGSAAAAFALIRIRLGF